MGSVRDPLGPSAALTQPQQLYGEASTDTNRACGYKERRIEPFQTHQELQSPRVKSEVTFYLIFVVHL